MNHPRQFLTKLFEIAVAAAHPANCLRGKLPPPPKGRTIVVGAGKASAAMAEVVAREWAGPLSGLVVAPTRYVPAECLEGRRSIKVVEAGHPHPTESGLIAAEDMLKIVSELTADDLVLALMSGGGSALLPCPAVGLTLEDEQRVNDLLLYSGATISEMNCVRKHISRIKGGRLALAAMPAKVISLIISDIPHDILGDVASGPTMADPTTISDALNVLGKYDLRVPDRVMQHLLRGFDETPKPDDKRLAQCEAVMVANSRTALDAAIGFAHAAKIATLDRGEADCGARELASEQAELARKCAKGLGSEQPPCLIISGGETTVKVDKEKKGRGGRNSEYALALAIELQGLPGVHALAADTDGKDGTEDNAGAFVAPDTLKRAFVVGLDPANYLRRNDAFGFFSPLGDLLTSGPTFTNVNDIRAILVEPVS
jgi:glycerate 2-kinase